MKTVGWSVVLAASVVKVDLPAQVGNDWLLKPQSEPFSALLPYIDSAASPKPAKGTAPEKRPEKSQVALRLEKLQVEERLRELRDKDADRTVRDAARRALARLGTVNEKSRE
jgi:hypothetical protein